MFRKKQKSKDEKFIQKHHQEVARAVEILFTTGYISRKRLYLENFIRGLFFSVGGIIGATLVIGLLVWILSLFDQVPLIRPLIENIRSSIEQGSSSLR